MRRIIVSSSALFKTLQQWMTSYVNYEHDYYLRLMCEDRKLVFEKHEKYLDVEAKNDWEIDISVGKLKRLIIFLKSISDQPLVITFQNNDRFIQIDNLLI